MTEKELVMWGRIFYMLAVDNKDDPRVWKVIEQLDYVRNELEKRLCQDMKT